MYFSGGTYLCGTAVTVNPANVVVTPPVGAKVTAGPPMDEISIRGVPLTADQIGQNVVRQYLLEK